MVVEITQFFFLENSQKVMKNRFLRSGKLHDTSLALHIFYCYAYYCSSRHSNNYPDVFYIKCSTTTE